MRRLFLLALAIVGLGVGLCCADAEETNQITATIVYDNYPHGEGLETDWGFASPSP